MAEATGKGGSVTFATGNVTNVKSWTLNYHADALDKTDFGDGASGIKSFIAGLTEWSGSYTCFLDDTAVAVAPGAAAASAVFTIATTQTLTGNIIVTDVDFDVPVDGLMMMNVSFQGDGALTIA